MVIYLSFLIAFLWGVSPVVHRYVLPHVSQPFVMAVSAVIYAISVFTYVSLFHSKSIIHDIKENIRFVPILAVTTFLGFFVANVIYLYVIKHVTNVNIATAIMALYPVVTLLLASWLLHEGLSFMSCVGFGLIVVGICIMLFGKI